jgi:hypothetical protein
MNWRRGLLLVGINLAVAVPLVHMSEVQDAATMRHFFSLREAPNLILVSETTPTSDPKEAGVVFDRCKGWIIHYPVQEIVLRSTNQPASLLAGWRVDCPASWSLAGMLHVSNSGPPSLAWAVEQQKMDRAVLLFIAIQWIFVGGVPSRRPWRWWAEPGMFITICEVIGLAVALLYSMHWIEDLSADLFANLAALCALCTWLGWFGLLVWKLGRSGWKWASRRLGASHT